jgi:dienelactone hydrolase
MISHSFVDFLDAYGRRYPPEMCYTQGEDFAQWRQRFRGALESLRGPVPDRVEPVADVVESVQADGHTRQLLRIPVSDVSTLPAYLLVPDDLAPGEQRPGLIASHGHVQFGIDSICGVRGVADGDNARRIYALEAVQAGYVVLAPAWWGWPGRDGHLDRVGTRDRCNVIQMAAGMYGMNVIDLHIQDGQAAVDVLSTRPEVDAEQIGCLGNSYGGRTTLWLTVFDERIKACVPAGCMNTFRERSLVLSSCGIQYPHGLLRYGDVPELFSLIAPRAMQLHVGRKDALITPSDRDAMEAVVRRAYRSLDAEENLEYALHNEGHYLLWDVAAPFLEKNLAIK